jgi:hypothetical protein
MTADHTRTFVRLCPDMTGHPAILVETSKEIALAVDVLEALLTDAVAFSLEDGVMLAACLDHRLFERIAMLGATLHDLEPDNDREETW